jgi:hypothetical protein
MKPDRNFVIHGIPEGIFYRCISEPGKQYAMYMHHSIRKGESYYFINPGIYRENLILSLPEGNYQAEWINPADGKLIGRVRIKSSGTNYILETPVYNIDIALRIKSF